MTLSREFVEEFLQHKYDPVKAREYYLRTRKLKGKVSASDAEKAKEYETRTTADAQNRLNADLKKMTVKKNPARRIGEAEQKLIRAKSLATRIKDPVLRADMQAKIAESEKKLSKVKAAIPSPAKKAATPAKKAAAPVKKAEAPAASGSKVTFSGKPVKIKPGTRMEEDESPETSPSGAKIKDFVGAGLGKAIYTDGSVFTTSGWQKPSNQPAKKLSKTKTSRPVLRRAT